MNKARVVRKIDGRRVANRGLGGVALEKRTANGRGAALNERDAGRERAKTPVASTHDVLSHDERRRADGKALRDKTPRASHGGWKPHKGRRDPIAILQESNEGRVPQLIPIRFGRMAQSAFAFYRGAAAVMAADLAVTPASGLRVQACGDAHMMNFGGFATPERNIFFDINDFDETLPAPWEWDVKRLAASLVIAARHIGLADSEAARAATEAVCCYRERMADYSSMRALDVWYDRIDLDRVLKVLPNPAEAERVRRRVEQARQKSLPECLYPKLVDHHGSLPRIKDDPPLLFHPTEEQAPGQTTGYVDAIRGYRKSLPEHVRSLFDRFHLLDFAIKVVGVGSVGTFCAIALFMASEDDPIFLQVKEARKSVLEPYAGKSLHANAGERVVAGQRLMQSASDIFLGWTRGENGRDYYFRQLRDAKISAVPDDWDGSMLREYGKLCAWALARAHARSGDAARMAGYLGSNTTFDDAVCEFAVEYADQNLRDYRAFMKAVREGRIPVETESE
jgi:uncharacterized protein (DUF2252 family)